MAADVDCMITFCLSCNKQVLDGPFCSEACRNTDFVDRFGIILDALDESEQSNDSVQKPSQHSSYLPRNLAFLASPYQGFTTSAASVISRSSAASVGSRSSAASIFSTTSSVSSASSGQSASSAETTSSVREHDSAYVRSRKTNRYYFMHKRSPSITRDETIRQCAVVPEDLCRHANCQRSRPGRGFLTSEDRFSHMTEVHGSLGTRPSMPIQIVPNDRKGHSRKGAIDLGAPLAVDFTRRPLCQHCFTSTNILWKHGETDSVRCYDCSIIGHQHQYPALRVSTDVNRSQRESLVETTLELRPREATNGEHRSYITETDLKSTPFDQMQDSISKNIIPKYTGWILTDFSLDTIGNSKGPSSPRAQISQMRASVDELVLQVSQQSLNHYYPLYERYETLLSDEHKRQIHILINEQNECLWRLDSDFEWTIASFDPEWERVNRKAPEIKAIKIILKTEPKPSLLSSTDLASSKNMTQNMNPAVAAERPADRFVASDKEDVTIVQATNKTASPVCRVRKSLRQRRSRKWDSPTLPPLVIRNKTALSSFESPQMYANEEPAVPHHLQEQSSSPKTFQENGVNCHKSSSSAVSLSTSSGDDEDCDFEDGSENTNSSCSDASSFDSPLSALRPILYGTKSEIVERVMAEFHKMFNSSQDVTVLAENAGSENGTKTKCAQDQTVYQSTESSKKRTFSNRQSKLPYDEDDDNYKERRKSGPDLLSGSSTRVERKLACPYYKRNPARHCSNTSCVYPGFPRVSRVKEHLYRTHALPIHCARCYTTFKLDIELAEHLRRGCDVQSLRLMEGFTREQETRLKSKKRTPNVVTEEEKWRVVYRILFPADRDEDIPSPYCDARNLYEDLVHNSPTSNEFAEFEAYSRRELPRLVRTSLEVIVERETQPLEESLMSQLVEIVRLSQAQLFSTYQQSRAVIPAIPTSPAGLMNNIRPTMVNNRGVDEEVAGAIPQSDVHDTELARLFMPLPLTNDVAMNLQVVNESSQRNTGLRAGESYSTHSDSGYASVAASSSNEKQRAGADQIAALAEEDISGRRASLPIEDMWLGLHGVSDGVHNVWDMEDVGDSTTFVDLATADYEGIQFLLENPLEKVD